MNNTGILVDIYKSRGQSYANGGVSDQCNQVVLLLSGGGGFMDPDKADAVVKIVPGNRPKTIKAIVVKGPGESGGAGPMMGGSYIASSDSRFSAECQRVLGAPFYGAVPLHDRFETWEQYEQLSR